MPAALDFAEQNAVFCAAAHQPGCGSSAVPNVSQAYSQRFTAHPFIQVPPFPANRRTRITMWPGSCSERTDLPLCARSVRSVNVGAMFDGYDGDLAPPIIDAVDHPVVTTASAVQPLETQLQRFADAVRACGQ